MAGLACVYEHPSVIPYRESETVPCLERTPEIMLCPATSRAQCHNHDTKLSKLGPQHVPESQ